MLSPAPFIVGVGRSGTTLLRLMLDAHPDLAIPTETHFLPSILDPSNISLGSDKFLELFTTSDTWPNMGVSADDLGRALAEIKPRSAAEAVRTFYGLYASRFGKSRWGDKTPPYRSCMTKLAEQLPEAHFIHVIRDGRDVALSYRGLWFGPGDGIEAQAQFWVQQIEHARAQAISLPHYIEVKFEQLVERSEFELSRLCNYLGLEFSPSMMTYFRGARERLSEFVQPFGPQPGVQPVSLERFLSIHDLTQSMPDVRRIGRWRTGLSREELRRYERIAGTLLQSLGYELSQ